MSEAELEDIVKMGMTGDRASRIAAANENDATRGLIGTYGGIVGGTPIRTPRAPQEEDRVANEVRNARARTETQSALLGGDNPDIYESEGTTGYQGAAPTKQTSATPNPLATPFRQGGFNAAGATPVGPGATPMRTPRDSFRLNDQTPGQTQLVNQTPRELKLQQNAVRDSLRGRLSALPKPKETEWELELPEEQQESGDMVDGLEEDSAIRDERERQIREATERAELKRQTQAVSYTHLTLPTKRIV